MAEKMKTPQQTVGPYEIREQMLQAFNSLDRTLPTIIKGLTAIKILIEVLKSLNII